MRPRQPLRHAMVGDNSAGTLVGSWCHKECDTYLADAAGPNDMTPVGTARSEECNTFWGDGNSDYLRAAVADYRISDSVGTIECWFNRDTLHADHTIFGSNDEGTDTSLFYVYVRAGNRLSIVARDAGGTSDRVDGDTVILADEWYYGVITSDGSTWAIYLNGVAETLAVTSGANNGDWFADVTLRDNVCIGAAVRNTIVDYFDGQVAGVNVYSDTKSADWAATRYANAVPDNALEVQFRPDSIDGSRHRRVFAAGGDPSYGSPIRHDGVVDYFETVTVVEDIDEGCTAAFWFQSRVDGQYQLVANTETVNQRSVVAVYAGGDLRAGFWQGAVYRSCSGPGATAGLWHHVVAAFDGDRTMYLYLNNVLLTGTTDPGSGNALRLSIGAATTTSDELDGWLDDVRYYSDYKTAAWVDIDYQRTAWYYAGL